ncbi:hypothetical protein SAMD00019534_111550 [Acytostelium subglobosum LB1]|uniref:hypothetical protein n=1 Tax=Acytostelium subglobosum LB1 TaxID=1410327 RepID=UPI000644F054|nr:hypothetical protein SAMD00019534_111550 [Acytostelium subglobosum LB1]GAM27979.1 hypothetical protein SAMD00019534_111550 [Acytostelium subglobosum LB1]|eukprot:XP_012748938.1 hypothetical protein SAMD00019534_111550 [Acytostelium subglobosum LB1]
MSNIFSSFIGAGIPDTNPNTGTITNGSLFHGNFSTYGDMWLAITFWCTVGHALTYLCTGFIASIVLRKSKVAPFIPVFSTALGILIGIGFGGISATIIAAIYRSSIFLLSWYQGIAWGIGLTVLHIILAFTLKVFQV